LLAIANGFLIVLNASLIVLLVWAMVNIAK
jgi:hypothetical protein